MAKSKILVVSATFLIILGLGLMGFGLHTAQGQESKRPEIEISRQARKNVEQFFEGLEEIPPWMQIDAYEELNKSIWKADSKVLDEYRIAIKQHPWPEDEQRRQLIWWILEEIERAKMPPVKVSHEVNEKVEGLFDKWDTADVAIELLHIVQELDEESLKEYIAAVRQHPWPGGEYHREHVEFLLYLLENPAARNGYSERLEAIKSGKFEIRPTALEIARRNFEDYPAELTSQEKRFRRVFPESIFDEELWMVLRRVLWDEVSRGYRPYEYIKVIKEMPWPEDEEIRELITSELEYYSEPETIERDHFRLELRLWKGYPQYREEARKDAEEFFKGILSPDQKERDKAAQEFLNKVCAAGEVPNPGRLYEYKLALGDHPLPLKREMRDITSRVQEELIELPKRAMKFAEIKREVEPFFQAIISGKPLERKEAIMAVVGMPWASPPETKPSEYIKVLQEHPWPEEEKSRRKIEMVLQVLKEQDDFFSERWAVVASPSGNADEVPDKQPHPSQRVVHALFMAKGGEIKIEHWPSLIKDENRPLMDRLWAAFYLDRYYVEFSLFKKPVAVEVSEVEKLLAKAAAETAEKWEPYIEEILQSPDKTTRLLLCLSLTFPGDHYEDKKSLIPGLLDGLENENLYLRLLSQDYLEKLTDQQFPLDPTDAAELRAPAIKQWQKWWEENKDKLRYDRMKDRLVQ